ncbi:hypothetical protein K3152_12150 [Qipengyuania sp. 1NDH17]|uniref:DUF3035 domain-containing protein n=1 Tax=Qipengyuania polymorpha TaxID=2867234 RepID=A0ABS7IZK5_9SPHN|nr:hypothetical protein [Qipengyuania polymorpha]MBX7459002.1 hypothetical protein [Qipengyuania polymorpha]
MTIEPKRLALLGLAAMSVSACMNNDGRLDLTQADPSWGEANRATMAAQVVNPSPEYENPIPPTSASNAVRAADAYRAGEVEEVQELSTTETISEGGN